MSKYYTVKEVAEKLQIKEQSVRNLLHTGSIKSEKVLNSRVVSESELKKQMKTRNLI